MNLKNVEKLEKNMAKLVLDIDKDQFTAALDKAYKNNRGSIAVPGFRKGKAPRKIIEGMYGASIFYEDAINILYPEVFPEAVKAADLKTVGNASVEDLNVAPDGSLTLTMSVALYPEVTLGQYKGVEAEKPVASVDDAAVDKEIDALLQRNSRMVSVERPIKEGDLAVIDFEGFIDGVAFEGGKGDNHTLKIGSGSFIPGFEDALIGVSAGESKDVEVTFPEDYHAELAGKPAVFKCFVHEVKEEVRPELDDEFAKDVSEVDTLSDLRASIQKRLADEAEENSKNAFTNAVLDKVIENMQCDIPDVMVDEQLSKLIENFSYQIQMNGMRLEDYLNMLGTDMAGLAANYRPTALRQVQTELALRTIAKAEGIEVSDEDVAAEYKRLAEQYDMEEERIRGMLTDDEIRSDLTLTKASEFVASAAVPVAPKEKDGAEEEKKPAKKTAKKAAKADEAEGEAPAKPKRTTKKKTEEAKTEE